MNPLEHFKDLSDPRKNNPNKLYSVDLILFLTLSAVISGADSWTEVEEFGWEKKDWLKKFVKIPDDRIPSHDTIGDFFSRLKAKDFSSCFLSWTSALTNTLEDVIVSVDGKTLRSSYDKSIGKKAIHMISAWANGTRLVLAQNKVDDKTNEIKAIPDLLSFLELQGALVTIDAMGCQKAIAAQILEQGGDYLLSVKGNQGELLRQIEENFCYNPSADRAQTKEKSHGRLETRICHVMRDLKEIDVKEQWPGLKTIIQIERTRENLSVGTKTTETMYYISSRQMQAEQALESVRSHWGVENQLHYVLDVEFKEDLSRVRKGDADQNLSIIRRIVLNLLKLNNSKGSMNIKRHRAAWSDSFREEILKI